MAWELFVKPSRAKHGTARAYQLSCRCDMCTEANTTRNRRQRLKRYEYTAVHGLPDSVPHGYSAYRNWGCCCDCCTSANSDQGAQRKQRTKRRVQEPEPEETPA